jgi:hypothetical protein
MVPSNDLFVFWVGSSRSPEAQSKVTSLTVFADFQKHSFSCSLLSPIANVEIQRVFF